MVGCGVAATGDCGDGSVEVVDKDGLSCTADFSEPTDSSGTSSSSTTMTIGGVEEFGIVGGGIGEVENRGNVGATGGTVGTEGARCRGPRYGYGTGGAGTGVSTRGGWGRISSAVSGRGEPS